MLQFTVFFLFVVQTSLSFVIDPRAGCSISISTFAPEPIVVSTKTYQFLYPAPDASAVSLTAGETIVVACPGGYLSIAGTKSDTTFQATCVSGTQFKVSGQQINLNQITCSRNPAHTARYTGQSCEAGGREIEVGFVLTNNEFARQFTICFDLQNLNTLYSAFELTKSIGHYESGVARPSFVEDNFYNLGVKVNDLYARVGQRDTINALLGLDASSTKYVQDTNDYYLARGHFTAKADFVYAPQQTATFHYVNAAPQWQTFNGDNWERVESSVRDYAEANKLDLKVYTGSYGVTTLPHERTGEEIPLYLYVDNNGNKAIPVPELYWKVVYDPATKKGVALLGLNNPYQDDLTKSLICQDISSSINWVKWKLNNQKSGYSYACNVDDLRRKISYLPDFEVRGLLL